MAKVMYYPFSSFENVLRSYARKAESPVICHVVQTNKGEMYTGYGPGVIFTGNSKSPVIHARRENMPKSCGFPIEKTMHGVLRTATP